MQIMSTFIINYAMLQFTRCNYRKSYWTYHDITLDYICVNFHPITLQPLLRDLGDTFWLSVWISFLNIWALSRRFGWREVLDLIKSQFNNAMLLVQPHLTLPYYFAFLFNPKESLKFKSIVFVKLCLYLHLADKCSVSYRYYRK